MNAPHIPGPTRDELTLLAACAMRFGEDFEANRAGDVSKGAQLVNRVHARILERIGRQAFEAFFVDSVAALDYYAAFHGANVADGSQAEPSPNDLAFFSRAALMLVQHMADNDVPHLVRGIGVVERARDMLTRRMGEDRFLYAFGGVTLERAAMRVFEVAPGSARFVAHARAMKGEAS